MKRQATAMLIAANLGLLAFACTDARVVGPAVAGVENLLDLISPKEGNALKVDGGKLYVEQMEIPEPVAWVSADSSNMLQAGADGLLFVPPGSGPQGPAGPEGPEGPAGPEGPPGTAAEPGEWISEDEENGLRVGSDGRLWIWRAPKVTHRYPSAVAIRQDVPGNEAPTWTATLMGYEMDLPFVVFSCMASNDGTSWHLLTGPGAGCSARQDGPHVRFSLHSTSSVEWFRVNIIHTAGGI